MRPLLVRARPLRAHLVEGGAQHSGSAEHDADVRCGMLVPDGREDLVPVGSSVCVASAERRQKDKSTQCVGERSRVMASRSFPLVDYKRRASRCVGHSHVADVDVVQLVVLQLGSQVCAT
jgi:hypothetical protein